MFQRDQVARFLNEFHVNASEDSNKNGAEGDKLKEITTRTDFFVKIEDIRDELHILTNVLGEQQNLFRSLDMHLGNTPTETSRIGAKNQIRLQDNDVLRRHLNRIKKMDEFPEKTSELVCIHEQYIVHTLALS